jgi:hypothetical protein
VPSRSLMSFKPSRLQSYGTGAEKCYIDAYCPSYVLGETVGSGGVEFVQGGCNGEGRV